MDLASLHPVETKIFDPTDGYAPFAEPHVVTDSSVVKRGDQWWMFLAGKVAGYEAIQLFSASLPARAPLSASGWRLTPHPQDRTRVAMLASQERSAPWDLNGGRHCPSYVKGFDPQRGEWVERIYYAGGADAVWGPYTIGYLEWDGTQWLDQPAPVFTASEDWELGSVYEPNLVYADGVWKMWYVAGSNQQDHLIHGYSESPNGRTDWTRHQVFAPPEMKMFDFCVLPRGGGFEAVFSRVWLGASEPPAETGLWWCQADQPASRIEDWSRPVQIMAAEDRVWRVGPFKPSFQYSESDPRRMMVFFDSVRSPKHPGYWPFALTLGCLEIDKPE